MARPGERAGAPVVCVGNFVAGGAGKTPAAIALARMLIADGRRVAFLSRGYGGAEARRTRSGRPGCPQREDGRRRAAAARWVAPCWVGADRVRGGRGWRSRRGRTFFCSTTGCRIPALVKDLAFAVVDGEQRFGNGLCVPAGPLRAPVAAQARFVQALIVIGGDEAASAGDLRARRPQSRSCEPISSQTPTRPPR